MTAPNRYSKEWGDSIEARLLALETVEPPPDTDPPGADYIEHCGRGNPLSQCFDFMFMHVDTGAQWFELSYARTLTYTPNTGWVDGDRAGYACAFCFLQHDDEIVGRVTFMRGALYGKINDQGMVERSRAYDGGPYLSQADCPEPDEEYEANDAPDMRPTLHYMKGAATLEVRPYPLIVAAGKFIQGKVITEPFDDVGGHPDAAVHTVYGRVPLIFYPAPGNLPGIVLYYDSLHPDVTITTDLP